MPPDPSQPRPALHYDGRLGELYPIFLLNVLLTVLTLGIYSFWAATRMRRYLWSRFAHDGRRFAYHGTGGELFVGWLLAILAIMGLFAVTVGLLYVLPLDMNWLALLLFYPTIGVLAGAGVFAAMRYRLSRTTWAGVRGGMVGSAWRYGLQALGFYVLLPLSLFMALPWVQVRLAERRVNAARAGAAPFRLAGRARAVYPVFLLVAVVTVAVGTLVFWGLLSGLSGLETGRTARLAPDEIIALLTRLYAGLFLFIGVAGVLGLFYRAALLRHVTGQTTLGPMRLGSSVTGWGLLWLLVGNGLIVLFTLGLGYPIAVQRGARFLARTTWAQGTLDPAALGTGTGAAPRFGEGLYSALDAGGMVS